ncbi:MAG: hypothetical protein KIT33_15085 [Candidatus Kapabacteria bacterium]|nr:hypothetical protein [Ignavibacteriota bacterium]MCW5886294.1 hypothetical protein [Candidatus Kapabacteria bacterium]
MNEYEIFSLISEVLGFKTDQIKSRSRKYDLVDARHITVYLLRNYTGLTLVEIGNMIKRHHTTVVNSIKKAKDYRKYNTKFKHKFQRAQKAIENHYIDRRMII